MKARKPRQTSFPVRHTADIGRAAWRVVYRWRMPRIEIGIDGIPVLEAQRSQVRLRHLHQAMERKTGALLAIAVLLIGLADMVRTWNRDLQHMGLLVAAAIGAGLAGRILGRAWVRFRVLLELARLRWKIGRWAARREKAEIPAAAFEARPAAPPGAAGSLPASALVQPRQLMKGSCCCGTVTFTLSSPPAMMGTCHCTACRKSGAGVFAMVKRSAFRLTSGNEAITSCRTAAPHECERCFCSRCGTALGEINSGSAVFRLAAGCLDDELAIRNGFHEFVGEKPSWYDICDDAKQFATQPGAAGVGE